MTQILKSRIAYRIAEAEGGGSGGISTVVTDNVTIQGDGSNASPVAIKNGYLTKSVVGLGNVDNTSDANKPVSTSQAAAISAAAAAAEMAAAGYTDTSVSSIQSQVSSHVNDLNNPHSVTKSQVGLGSVDNTSDANKPVSTVQQLAINEKVDTFTTTRDVSGDHTLDSTDLSNVNAGKSWKIEGDLTGDLTIPLNATVDFPKSTLIEIDGFSNISIAGGGSIVGTRGDNTLPVGVKKYIEQIEDDNWILYNGDPVASSSVAGITKLYSGTGNNTDGAMSQAATVAAIASAVEGLKWKDSVKVATTANITLSGEQTIDGVLTSASRILVKNQSTASQNGIYVTASGAWSRASDANSAAELEGATVTVQEGTSNANTTWTQTTDGITLGSSNLVWAQFGTSVADASSSTKGIAKLYANLSASNTDGAPDQASVKTALDLKAPLASPAFTGTVTHSVISEVVAGRQIIWRGDSLTWGANTTDNQYRFSTVVSAKVGATENNLGIVGAKAETTGTGNTPVYNSAIHYAIVFEYGINDFVAGRTALQFRGDMETLVTDAIAKGWPRIFICSVPGTSNAAVADYNAQLADLASDYATGYANIYDPLRDSDNGGVAFNQDTDFVHGTNQGHALMADIIYSVIKEAFTITDQVLAIRGKAQFNEIVLKNPKQIDGDGFLMGINNSGQVGVIRSLPNFTRTQGIFYIGGSMRSVGAIVPNVFDATKDWLMIQGGMLKGSFSATQYNAIELADAGAHMNYRSYSATGTQRFYTAASGVGTQVLSMTVQANGQWLTAGQFNINFGSEVRSTYTVTGRYGSLLLFGGTGHTQINNNFSTGEFRVVLSGGVDGSLTQMLGLLPAGRLQIRAGLSSGLLSWVGGVIGTDTTQTGNVGTGEDTLQSYSLVANVLGTNKDSVWGRCSGTFGATANNKRLRFKFGSTTILDSGDVAINSGSWVIEFAIVRTGAATQKCWAVLTTSSSLLPAKAGYAAATQTLSNSNAITVTGEATADNDIVKETFKVLFEPAEA